MEARSRFETNYRGFVKLVILYVVAVPVAHGLIPATYAWWIATAFSIIMNFVYPLQAKETHSHFGLELKVAVPFGALSLMGPLVHPLFVIAAIAGHGVWDWCKHKGQGVRFFTWYPPACAIFDFGYAAALAWYFASL